MNKTLRQVAVTAGMCLTVALFGCGGGSGSAASEEKPAAEESAAEETAAEEEEAAETEEATEEAAKTELGSVQLEVASSNYRYKLKEVGSFEGDRRSVSFQYDGAIGFDDSGNAQLLGTDGQPLLDGTAVKGIDYWGGDLYLFALDSDDINNCGLVSLKRGELIPAEAATLSYATEDAADARFIEVVYATEETDNEDECFVYSTDRAFAITMEEGDTMYKGYAKVFDLEKGAFVDGVEIDNGSRTAFKDLGDAFVVEGKDGTYTMYDETGKSVWSSDLYPNFGRHSLSISIDGEYRIINTKGEVTFASEDPISALTSTNDLYLLRQDDGNIVIDAQGNVALEGSHETIQGEYNGLFVVMDDEQTQVVDGTGKVLCDDIEQYTVSEMVPGYLLYKNGAGEQCYLKSDGTQIAGVEGSYHDLVCYKDKDYMVLKDGEYSLPLSSGDALDVALVSGRADESMSTSGLYDLFTGKELLDSSYEVIDWAGGYVYAFKDGTWTVYRARRVAK